MYWVLLNITLPSEEISILDMAVNNTKNKADFLLIWAKGIGKVTWVELEAALVTLLLRSHFLLLKQKDMSFGISSYIKVLRT